MDETVTYLKVLYGDMGTHIDVTVYDVPFQVSYTVSRRSAFLVLPYPHFSDTLKGGIWDFRYTRYKIPEEDQEYH